MLCPSWFAEPDPDIRAELLYSAVIDQGAKMFSLSAGLNPFTYVHLAQDLWAIQWVHVLKRGEPPPPLPDNPFPTPRQRGAAIG